MKYVITVELNDGNGYKYATGGYVSTSEIEKNINNSTIEYLEIGHGFFKRDEIKTLFIEEVPEDQVEEVLYGNLHGKRAEEEAEVKADDGTDHD